MHHDHDDDHDGDGAHGCESLSRWRRLWLSIDVIVVRVNDRVHAHENVALVHHGYVHGSDHESDHDEIHYESDYGNVQAVPALLVVFVVVVDDDDDDDDSRRLLIMPSGRVRLGRHRYLSP